MYAARIRSNSSLRLPSRPIATQRPTQRSAQLGNYAPRIRPDSFGLPLPNRPIVRSLRGLGIVFAPPDYNSPEYQALYAQILANQQRSGTSIPFVPPATAPTAIATTGRPGRGSIPVSAPSASPVPTPAPASTSSSDAAYVTSLYTSLLGRTPSSSEVSFWVNQIASGVSYAQVQQQFLASPEYLSLHSTTPTTTPAGSTSPGATDSISTFVSSVPTWAWIAGGAALFLMKKK